MNKLNEAEAREKTAALKLAKQKGYKLKWLHKREWHRRHIAAIDPGTDDFHAAASHWSGIVKFLKQAPFLEKHQADGD